MRPLADLALRAGDLLAVEVGAEVVAGVAVLVAVLAGAVAGQRPGEGDLVFAPGPLHVDQGGVAAVRQVLGGEQAPPLQPSVDAGHRCGVRAGGGHGCDVGDDVGAVGGAGLGRRAGPAPTSPSSRPGCWPVPPARSAPGPRPPGGDESTSRTPHRDQPRDDIAELGGGDLGSVIGRAELDRVQRQRLRGAAGLQRDDSGIRPARDHLRVSLPARVGVAEQPLRASLRIRRSQFDTSQASRIRPSSHARGGTVSTARLSRATTTSPLFTAS